MEKVEFKIPYTKFGTIFANQEGNYLEITGVSKDYDKKLIWSLDHNGYKLWKYSSNFAIYEQDKKFIALGLNRDDKIVEISFSKRPNRHIIQDESPEKSYWYSHDLATFDYRKIISLGEKVIKRTQEEARIKAEKLLHKHANENRAMCGACERYIERWDEGNRKGVIYDHGFQQAGYRAGVCVGARYQPWEKSAEGKVAYVSELHDELLSIIKKKPTFDTLKILIQQFTKHKEQQEKVNQAKKDHWNDFKDSQYYYLQNDYRISSDRKNKVFMQFLNEEKGFDLEIHLTKPVFFGIAVWPLTTIEELLDAWQFRADYVKNIINKEEEKIKNWKQQLTPREKIHG